MVKNKKQQGYTLLEILVTLTILTLIIAIGFISYNQITITSRDSARKTDLAGISSALEQFKSNNANGSYPDNLNSLVPTYLGNLPRDPKTNTTYNYSVLPAGCLPSIENPCISYSLSTTLEKDGQLYTINPYGK